MTLNIKAQDKTEPVKFEATLHPDRIKRLKEYAKSLDNSDVDYVLDRILDEVLPVEKPVKKAAKDGAEKKTVEMSRKAATG